VLLVFGALVLLQVRLDRTRHYAQPLRGPDELMYFPSGTLLTPIAGEYRGVVADFAWLKAIQYYAYHLSRDQVYEWFEHIIRTITRLDPHFIEAYRFGSFVISWDSNQPTAAISLLREGMEHNPMTWELPFQVAFVAYVKMKEYRLAARYFRMAAQLPGVWSMVPRWAAVAFTKSGNLELAREIWTRIYSSNPNERLKQLARRQLVGILRDQLGNLQSAVDSLTRTQGRALVSLQELVDAGSLDDLPVEPFGGRYLLRSGRVVSSSVETTRHLMVGLQKLIDRYQARYHAGPQDWDALVKVGLLNEPPTDPFGGILAIEQGKVEITLELP
jgi:hypothetical protein